MEESTRARLPLDLTVVGLLLVYYGMAAACKMVAGLFCGSFTFDLTVLALPAGIGLLRLRASWRNFLLVLYYIGFALISTAVILALGRLLLGHGGMELTRGKGLIIYGQHIGPLPLWLGLDAALVWLVLYVWTFLVLRRPGVERLYSDPIQSGSPLSRPLRIGVAVAIFLALAQTAGALYVRQTYPATNEESTWGSSARMQQLAWGYRWGRLAYVVYLRMDGDPETKSATISGLVQADQDGAARMVMPAAHEAALPGEHFIYNRITGQWRVSDFRVTGPEFDAFRDSEPDDYSMDALVEFVSRLRASAPG